MRRSELEAFRDQTVPDLVGDDVRLLVVGINPGLVTAAVQAHFARRGNRFYPALYRAGIVDRLIDASSGCAADDVAHLRERGLGITNLVARATARADELSREELVAGAAALTDRVRTVRPALVAVLGITAYRAAFARPAAITGPQAGRLADVPVWVLPNPSGLNAHAQVGDLAADYRAAAIAAGIDVFDRPV